MSKYRPLTGDQLERRKAYQREYRANNRDRVKQWRRNYVLRLADRLKAAESHGADLKGGDPR